MNNLRTTFTHLICLTGLICVFGTTKLSGQSALEVERVSITVSNLEEATDFYTNILPFKVVSKHEVNGSIIQPLFGLSGSPGLVKMVTLALGNEQIQLMEFEHSASRKKIPLDSQSNDLWFQHVAIVVSDIDSAYQILRKNQVQHVSTAPQTLPEYIQAASGISAFYFRDPDGHNLEIIQYPPGKGNPKWQQSNHLFLGIDHTAIGISSTVLSTKFYSELIGLTVAGNSENYGPEQERLNQVFGAHLLITGLHAKEGYGVEFLQYLAPPGGRPYPETSAVTDLWHWHTHIRIPNLSELVNLLKQHEVSFVSQEIIKLSHEAFDFQEAILVRDPDEHAILLTN